MCAVPSPVYNRVNGRLFKSQVKEFIFSGCLGHTYVRNVLNMLRTCSAESIFRRDSHACHVHFKVLQYLAPVRTVLLISK